MADEEHNPYAPPAEPVALREGYGDEDGDREASDYSSERRPVLLCILLTFVSCGFYQSIWLLRRAPFLDRLNASKRLGSTLPIFVLVSGVGSFVVALAGKEAASVQPLVGLVGTIAAIVANFRVADILRSDSTRTGRFIRISSLWTFLLGIYYLQYKINQLADLPAHVPAEKRRKKRKRKPAPETTETTETTGEA